ncbi:MAG TPA: hypothetical protein VI792_04435 [Candidatus Eisenbacteria bacterium]
MLIDFDWQDADLLPVLCRHPELSIRLVAGAQSDDPGLRVAELCGLPRTVDLGDLTREIFDLALVSERSARRTQVEGLLRVLGTRCVTPESFLNGNESDAAAEPGIEAPLALQAVALESALGGGDMNDIVDQALPDLALEAAAPPHAPVKPRPASSPLVQSLEDFPSPADRQGLEQALTGLMSDTGATAAELHAGKSGDVQVLAKVGDPDELLQGLVDLAIRSEEAQVVQRLSGPDEGKAWGAWPFRTNQHQGVLAAAAIDPASGWTMWEKTVEELRSTWDLHDREQTEQSFPLVPQREPGWLDREGFRERVDLAVQRNRRDGLRFAIHRFSFPEVQEPVEHFCHILPDQLRDTDSICRPSFYQMLLLTPHAPGAYAVLRTRLLALLEHAWRDAGQPDLELGEEELVLARAEEGEAFLARAAEWLGAD